MLRTLSPEDLVRGFPEPEQADEDVLLGVLVGEEGLPPLVGHVVAPDQLNLEVVENFKKINKEFSGRIAYCTIEYRYTRSMSYMGHLIWDTC